MARKKSAAVAEQTVEPTTGPDVIDEAIAAQNHAAADSAAQVAAGIVQQVADNTALPTEPPATGVILNPSSTPRESHAEQVGRRQFQPQPDPFGIAGDYAAGVRLLESRRDKVMAIKFGEGRPEDKPSQAVLDKLKESGFRWNGQHKVWTLPVRPETAMQTRIDAERVFKEVAGMIRQEKGIGQEVGA